MSADDDHQNKTTYSHSHYTTATQCDAEFAYLRGWTPTVDNNHTAARDVEF